MLEIFSWIESTGLARSVGESLAATAWLSALHLIGFTLVMSGGFVWNLRAAGLLLSGVPTQSLARIAWRLVVAGLAISLATGFALFAPRASSTALSGAFQLKMLLLVLAATFQLTTNAMALGSRALPQGALRAAGTLGLMLWSSLAVTACWFILFE